MPPVGHIPIAFAVVAVMAKYLQIVDVKGKTRK
jgi:hypothetical protein